MKKENSLSICMEEQKFKRKELVLKIKSLIDYINSITIEDNIKIFLINHLDQILKRAIITEEVVRLADVVYKITKSEDTDIKYKGFLKSAIYKIYSDQNII